MNKVAKKFQNLRQQLNNKFFERETIIDGLLSCLVSRQHILLLGPPGTAKSALANSLCKTLTNSVFFVWLMTRFTVPEEVYGTVKLSGLDQDKYERKIEGKLPTAHIAFLDEIFKANSAINNSLLTIVQEREFDNDVNRIKVPLQTLIGASNELPESEELGALYDRFILRFWVDYIVDEKNLKDLLFGKKQDVTVQISLSELKQAQQEAEDMPWSNSAMEMFFDIKRALASKGYFIGDRRMEFIRDAIQGYAYISGKSEVDTDCFELLPNMVWNKPEEEKDIEAVVTKLTNPTALKALELQNAAQELFSSLMNLPKVTSNEKSKWQEKAGSIITALDEIKNKLQGLILDYPNKAQKAQKALRKVSDLRKSISKEIASILQLDF